MRVPVPASLSTQRILSASPVTNRFIIRLVFAGVSACIVMFSQRILSASPGTQIQILGSCLRVFLPASLCPLSGFYPLRPVQLDSNLSLVFAGVSACIAMSTQWILSASLVTNKFINSAHACGCLCLNRYFHSAGSICFARYKQTH